MPDTVRCECGNEVRSIGVSPVALKCAVCGRRPPIGVAVVNNQIGVFAALLMVLSILTAAPGIWVMVESLTRPAADGVNVHPAVWVYVCIFAALVQIGYAVYLLQFPHWASLQAVAVVSLFWGVIGAIVFGGALVGSSAGWAGTLLQFGDSLPAVRGPKVSTAALWCFLLTIGWTSFSIWCGWRAQLARTLVKNLSLASRPD